MSWQQATFRLTAVRVLIRPQRVLALTEIRTPLTNIWMCETQNRKTLAFGLRSRNIKFTPEQAIKAHRGSRSIALLFL